MADTPYILRAADIAAAQGTAKTHFLNPQARRINKSLGDMTGLTGLGVHLIEVAPGDVTTEHHMHYHEDECVYVLDGHATAVIGEDETPIGPGDFIGYRKGGAAHSIRNTGDCVLRCLVIGQRLPHDVADYTRLDKRIFSNDGVEWNVVEHAAIMVPGGGAGKK